MKDSRRPLSAEQRRVVELCGTEPPWSSPLLDEHRSGTYHCVACDAPLFTSDTKFDSGSGWPSFFAPALPHVVGEQTDTTHGMTRTEVHCANCQAHLGHVFDDGPPPNGLRYCINGIVLIFTPEE
jgi:peptide-methionine (R)-S-oxide reductase